MPLKKSTREQIRPVVPKLIALIEEVVYPDIWERPELAKRDRSLVTIAALICLRQTEQLRLHLELGLANGLTADEISELITHTAIYAGFPAANSAAVAALPVFKELGLIDSDSSTS
tara:strand:- start:14900 stop:15247 length:348 start_codon:yes stop_codon:yes gene_type:complete